MSTEVEREEPSADLEVLWREVGGADRERGLSESEAAKRLAERGPNEIPKGAGKGPVRILLQQLTASLVLVLIAAAVISAFLGDYVDAGAIGCIVVLNALLGFHQEYRAEKAMAELRRISAPQATVRRGGRPLRIPSREIVAGDVLLLAAGDSISSDARLLSAPDFQTQEAALTGESEPVDKDAAFVPDSTTPVAEMRHMVFAGTAAVRGRAVALTCRTGAGTELGRIASLLQGAQRRPTPLQMRLARLGRLLALAALLVVLAVFAIGLLGGQPSRLVFMTALSLAVAVVPEGLPAAVTIALALASQRMLAHRALIRKLPAVETLGSVTVICSDKTGTLTQNRMQVRLIETADGRLELNPDEETDSGMLGRLVLTIGAACNDATLGGDDAQGPSSSDPTELALAEAARRLPWGIQEFASWDRLAEVSFDASRKRMSTLHPYLREHPIGELLSSLKAPSSDEVLFVKGAVDELLASSEQLWTSQGPRPLREADRDRLTKLHEEGAAQGLRMLAMAAAFPAERLSNGFRDDHPLIFAGMVGMQDPPRPEAAQAVATCRAAGIRPMMITGDHPLTARAIAREIGIDGGRVVTGAGIEEIPLDELAQALSDVDICARVLPEHKLRIVEALQRGRQIVAMTGDGVNDAPALKRADIGVAMGLTGTDVAKEAADMVLLDDDFATIVAAVREGRTIYANIRRFVRYLLGCNLGETLVMLTGPLLGMPLPLLPLQILWMNLVTDGLPALALGIEQGHAGAMRRPPRRVGESIFSHGLGFDVVWTGMVLAIVSLGVGWWSWHSDDPHWQTLLFCTLTFAQAGIALTNRSRTRTLWSLGLFSNRFLAAAAGSTIALQIGILYFPPAASVFGVQPLPWLDLLTTLGLASALVVGIEITKPLRRHAED